MSEQYKNNVGVVVSAEQITDDKEHDGFWLTIDKDGNKGRVPDELFKQTFSLVDTATTSKSGSRS